MRAERRGAGLAWPSSTSAPVPGSNCVSPTGSYCRDDLRMGSMDGKTWAACCGWETRATRCLGRDRRSMDSFRMALSMGMDVSSKRKVMGMIG